MVRQPKLYLMLTKEFELIQDQGEIMQAQGNFKVV